MNGDALKYLNGDPQAFDIVFLDPPFSADWLEDLCRLLDEGKWLTRGARIYLEEDRDRALPVLPDGWTILKEKTAGQVRYALVAVKD